MLFLLPEKDKVEESDGCVTKCSDDSACGGPNGQISVFTNYKAKAAGTLEVKPVNLKDEDVTADKDTLSEVTKEKKLIVGEVKCDVVKVMQCSLTTF